MALADGFPDLNGICFSGREYGVDRNISMQSTGRNHPTSEADMVSEAPLATPTLKVPLTKGDFEQYFPSSPPLQKGGLGGIPMNPPAY
jgi:hypothetical protein